ncbi:MAG: cystatin domain-containing protein [Thiolinea sp.]
MKRYSLTCTCLLALLTVGCTQEPAMSPTALPDNTLPTAPRPGGYGAADVNDPGVRAAADFAVSEIGGNTKLASIQEASRQVVAGMNYRMTLKLSDGSLYQVVVYRNLQGQYSLSTAKRL